MGRAALTLSFGLLVLAGCAPAMAIAPIKEPPKPEPAPIAVTYEVAQSSGAQKRLLSGAMDVSSRWDKFAQRAPKSDAAQNVEMRADARPDGTYLVDVRYMEITADGEKLDWQPTLVAKRGEKAVARVDWAGGGRSISLTVQ